MINQADCVNDDVLSFGLTVAGTQNAEVQVWAGTACETVENRSISADAPCWMLFSAPPGTGSLTASLHVRDILAGRTLNLIGNNPLAPVGTLVAGPEACVPTNLELSQMFQIQLYFMLVDDRSSVIGEVATWTARAKIVGPPPPAQMTVESGSERLLVHFQYQPEQRLDATFNGYTFYCDPPPSSAMPTGASPGTSDAQPLCDSTTELMAGSAAEAKYVCGGASATATEGEILDLQASTPYHVAIAATDTFQNIGLLSTVACGVPRTKDVEVRACSVSRRGAPRGVGLGAAALALALWSLRLARRRAGATRRSDRGPS